MTEEFRIISKEQLRERAQIKTDIVPLPELGEGFAVRVKELTLGEKMDIRTASVKLDENAMPVSYDEKQDVILSVLGGVVEPKLGLEDAGWVLSLPDSVVTRIIGAIRRLGSSSQSDYDVLKQSLKLNPYVRRIYSVCVNKLGRLPIELADIPESEFNTALAALELDAEDEEKQIKEMMNK
jgi:hypothetical protein